MGSTPTRPCIRGHEMTGGHVTSISLEQRGSFFDSSDLRRHVSRWMTSHVITYPRSENHVASGHVSRARRPARARQVTATRRPRGLCAREGSEVWRNLLEDSKSEARETSELQISRKRLATPIFNHFSLSHHFDDVASGLNRKTLPR